MPTPRSFTPANAGELVRTTTPWSKLPPAPTSLEFRAAGRGEVSVAASLRFVPAELLPFSSYRGLWVQRVIQIVGEGGNLNAVPLGSTVNMVIQVRGETLPGFALCVPVCALCVHLWCAALGGQRPVWVLTPVRQFAWKPRYAATNRLAGC